MDSADFFIRLIYNALFFFRYENIINGDGNTALSCEFETEVFQIIKKLNCSVVTNRQERIVDNCLDFFLVKQFIDVFKLIWHN